MQTKKGQKGFSLVELTVVVGLLGIVVLGRASFFRQSTSAQRGLTDAPELTQLVIRAQMAADHSCVPSSSRRS